MTIFPQPTSEGTFYTAVYIIPHSVKNAKINPVGHYLTVAGLYYLAKPAEPKLETQFIGITDHMVMTLKVPKAIRQIPHLASDLYKLDSKVSGTLPTPLWIGAVRGKVKGTGARFYIPRWMWTPKNSGNLCFPATAYQMRTNKGSYYILEIPDIKRGDFNR